MEYSNIIWPYEFIVEITSLTAQPSLGMWAETEDDCYGYTELEFDYVSATMEDEEGNEIELLGEDIVDAGDQHYQEIYVRLLELVN